jgi:DNA-binding response OmpR family regulator
MRAIGRILVVDDDSRLRQVIAEFLRDEGFAVATAATGIQALAIIDEEQPALILLDMHLPEMDGRELASEIRARAISLPIIVMTAASDARDWALEIGAVSYIPKPVSLPSLVKRLDELAA